MVNCWCDLEGKNEQLEIIHAFISERDVFGMLPTGFGKSLCYTCLLVTSSMLSCKTNYITAVQMLYRQLTRSVQFTGSSYTRLENYTVPSNLSKFFIVKICSYSIHKTFPIKLLCYTVATPALHTIKCLYES